MLAALPDLVTRRGRLDLSFVTLSEETAHSAIIVDVSAVGLLADYSPTARGDDQLLH